MRVCYRRHMNDRTELTEQRIRAALTDADGSPTRAAVALGVSRQTIWRRMKLYGIEVKRTVGDRAA